MIDIKKVKEDAAKEIREEREKAAKEKLIAKLRQIEYAEKVLRNLRAELVVLEEELGADV